MEAEEWPPVKPQTVRILDVAVLGPSMVFAGATASVAARKSPLLQLMGLITFVGGFATIGYNAYNYGKIAQRQKRLQAQGQQQQAVQGLGSGYWAESPPWGYQNAAWQRYMATGMYVTDGA